MSEKYQISEIVEILHYVATHEDVTSIEISQVFDRGYKSASKTLRKLWQNDLLTRHRNKPHANEPYYYNLKR